MNSLNSEIIVPLRYKLEKLNLNGTENKKDIILLKMEEDANVNQLKSLQKEISDLKSEAQWKNVVFLILPKHISLTQLSEEELNSLNLYRK